MRDFDLSEGDHERSTAGIDRLAQIARLRAEGWRKKANRHACAECGDKIGWRRRTVYPAARLCIECAQTAELHSACG